MSSAYRTEAAGPAPQEPAATYCADCKYKYLPYDGAEWNHWHCGAPTGKINPVTGRTMVYGSFCQFKNTNGKCKDFVPLPVVMPKPAPEPKPEPKKPWWKFW